jgi:DNA-binding GntR family transcriptional regulator
MSHVAISNPIELSHRAAAQARKAPIQRQALSDELAERLRGMIVEGELRPGGRITTQRLCARFGVSRTPLREALKMLAIEGLVQLMPNRSAVVERITPEIVENLVPILGALEAVAGQIACARIDAAALSHIEALHERLVHHFENRDERSYLETEDAIRAAVFAATGNDTLIHIHATLIMKLRWPMVATGAPPEWDKAVEEQQRMLRALQVRDGDLWAMAAHRHIRHRAAVMRRGVDRMGGGKPPARGTAKSRAAAEVARKGQD